MKDMREFITAAERLGELKIIKGANWEWEIGAVTYAVAAGARPPAVLFDEIEGYKPGYRVLTIPFATDKRVALVLGQPQATTRPEIIRGLRDKMSAPVVPLPPVEVADGPVLENVHQGDEVNLDDFPAPVWQPGDGGRYIGTGDTVIIKDPDEGWVNVSVNRIQVHDATTATIYFAPGRHGDVIRKKYWARGESCPVAVTCGCDPLLFFNAATPLPWGMSEYDYTGWWQNEAVEVIRGPITGLPIPARAEIVLEGEMVSPEVETRNEGPFPEFTGHYTKIGAQPAFRVKGIMHRNDPIILGALHWLGPGVNRDHLPYTRAARVWSKLDELVPGVKGVWIPPEMEPAATVISLEQHYSGHAKQAALAALSVESFMRRYVIVVDHDVDPYNFNEVLHAMSFRAEPEEFDIIRGWRGGGLDPRLSPEKRARGENEMSTAIILACRPFHWRHDFPLPVKPDPDSERAVRKKWPDL